MVEGEDPLETGLEIVAKPPGKKPATLSLLSGGEQTLTALALIFAVFLTNPSPICVLDEVDAPLDDANVDRFCTLMEHMAADTATRFLVITHHPMTMTRMNRLFGVTMGEKRRQPAGLGRPRDRRAHSPARRLAGRPSAGARLSHVGAIGSFRSFQCISAAPRFLDTPYARPYGARAFSDAAPGFGPPPHEDVVMSDPADERGRRQGRDEPGGAGSVPGEGFRPRQQARQGP